MNENTSALNFTSFIGKHAFGCQKIDMNGLNFTCHHSTFRVLSFIQRGSFAIIFNSSNFLSVCACACVLCCSDCIASKLKQNEIKKRLKTFLCNYYFTCTFMTQAICAAAVAAAAAVAQHYSCVVIYIAGERLSVIHILFFSLPSHIQFAVIRI